MHSNYPPGVTGSEPEIVGYSESTPIPWDSTYAGLNTVILGADGITVCVLEGPKAEENAKLIVTVCNTYDDLLAALEALVAALEWREDEYHRDPEDGLIFNEQNCLDAARDAIAKSKGD